MREMWLVGMAPGLQHEQGVQRTRSIRTRCAGADRAPQTAWVLTDITYIRLAHGFRVPGRGDWYTAARFSWRISNSIDVSFVLTVRGRPARHAWRCSTVTRVRTIERGGLHGVSSEGVLPSA
jgi:hypothetical protein